MTGAEQQPGIKRFTGSPEDQCHRSEPPAAARCVCTSPSGAAGGSCSPHFPLHASSLSPARASSQHTAVFTVNTNALAQPGKGRRSPARARDEPEGFSAAVNEADLSAASSHAAFDTSSSPTLLLPPAELVQDASLTLWLLCRSQVTM